MFVDLSRPIWKPSLSSCMIPSLYVKSPSYAGVGPEELTIAAHEYADFMTYFGSFSLKKWRRYTGIVDLTPTLVLESSELVSVTLTVMPYRRLEKRVLKDAVQNISRTDDKWYRYEIAYPQGLDTQLVAFTVVAGDKPAVLRSIAYCADMPSKRDVRIEIITTTFRKERQVRGNMDLIRKQLLADPVLGDHFRLTVVDNGRTLSQDTTMGDPRITLIPNGNVGGAGGFAAGMLHAAEEGWATHVLLMDDDVNVCPESYKRTLRVLENVSDEYRDATVAGAMLSASNFELQHEDIGMILPERTLRPFKPQLIMDREYDICFNEEMIPSERVHGLYSAWWYSCFPVRRVYDYGLPIPLFYRRDDVEYSTRIQQKEQLKFITLNGVCVWHEPFDLRWNAAVEVYLATRNMLIQEAFTPDSMNSMQGMVDLMRERLVDAGRRFDYASMDLICEAIEDYLKGPDYYRHPVGEKLLVKASSKAEKVRPLNEIEGAPDSIDIVQVEKDANDDFVSVPVSPAQRELRHQWLRKLHRIMRGTKSIDGPRPTETVVIPIDGWCRPWRIMQNAAKAWAVDTTGQRGALRIRDDARRESIIARYDRLATRLLEDVTIGKAYQDSRDEMTSFEFWKTYLEEAKQCLG